MAFLIPQNIPSRNDLPASLQTVARALRDLPDEVTVWLERSGSGDRATLAAEFDIDFDQDSSPADQDPYLVVLDPASGIAVLEAPSRKALARRGIEAFRRKLDIARIQSDVNTRVKSLSHQIRGAKNHRINRLPIKQVTALPNVRRANIPAFARNLPVLSWEDLEPQNLGKALRRILDNRTPALTGEGEKAVRAVVNPRIVIKEDQSTDQGRLLFDPPSLTDPDQVIAVLDRRQERLAMSLGPGYRIIRGVAGSGKTLILTYRARYIAEHFPSARVLLLCYNRPLYAALEQEVADMANIRVRTVDGLAADLLKGSKHRYPSPKTDEDWRKRRLEAISRSVSLDNSQKYDLVLVDEAQDLETSHLDLAYSMLKRDNQHFVMALDSAQNIYRRRMTWNPPGMTARGRSTILRRNYRNTREILEPAVDVLMGPKRTATRTAANDLAELVLPEKAERSGRKSLILECADLKAETAKVARMIKERCRSGAEPGEIVVLSGSKKHRYFVLRALKEKGVKTFDAQIGRNKSKSASVRDAVRIASLHLFKGLEFPHVFISAANHIWVQDEDAASKLDAQKRLLYTGMTRGTQTLTITFSGAGPVADALRAARTRIN